MVTMVAALDPAIRRHRFTVAEVLRMADSGILEEDAPVELLDGELIDVSPQGPEHATGKAVLRDALRLAYAGEGCVREQDPLVAGEHSLPEPDLAVVRGAPRDYGRRHPRGDEALLVVEVSRTSHRVDQAKTRIYARAGVPEYWIVDLVARVVTIHRGPGDAGYATAVVIDEQGTLELPRGVRCPVIELLF